MKLTNVKVERNGPIDYPDFTNCYIAYAEDEDGRELTEEELESIPEDEAYDYFIAHFF